MELISFVKEIFVDAVKTATSKKRIRSFYGVSLYRNSLYLMMSSAVLAVTGFVFWILAARFYSERSVGLSSAAISAMALVAILSTLGLDYGLIRFLGKFKGKANEIINSCFTIGGAVSIVLAFIFLWGVRIWSPALLRIQEYPVFLIAFGAFTAFSTLNEFLKQIFIAKRKTEFVLIRNLIFGFLKLIPLPVFAALFPTFGIFGSLGIALGVTVAAGMFLFLPKIQIGYHPSPMIRKELLDNIADFSLANYAANVFWLIPGYLLPLMVLNLLGPELNAYFYVSWTVGSLLFILPLATSFSLFAEGSHSKEKTGEDVRRSFKLTLVLVIPAIIIVLLLGDKILLLFGMAYSKNGTKLLWILASSVFPLSINHIYFSVKRVEMRMKSVVSLNSFIAIVTLGLSYLLLMHVGIIGTGIAWLVSHGLASIVALTSLRRYCGRTERNDIAGSKK